MNQQQAWYDGWAVIKKKKGPGRGWWGPPKGTHGPGNQGGTKINVRGIDYTRHDVGGLHVFVEEGLAVDAVEATRGLSKVSSKAGVEDANVVLKKGPCPQNDHWAEVYGEPGFEAFASSRSEVGGVGMTFWDIEKGFSAAEVQRAAIHEFGHIYANQRGGVRGFQEAVDLDGPFSFPTSYARAGPKEDFAESFEMYFVSSLALKALCHHRYVWFEEEFG